MRVESYRLGRILAAVALLCSSYAAAQTTSIKTEYLMSTMSGSLEPGTLLDNSLIVVNVKPGGWIKGPRISGKFVAPCADWVRIMPSGVLRLDVKCSILTEDNAPIYMTYSGIVQHSPESAERLNKGEVLTTKDIPYFIAAPTFQTSSEKYAWLNSVQAVGKLVEIKIGEGGYVKYDFYVVR
jgi:hypothetical protein